MRRSSGLILAWVGATVLAVTVAATAVGSVRTHVTDSPTVLGSPAIAVAIGPTDEVASTTTTTSLSADGPERIPTTTSSATTSTKEYDTEAGSVLITIQGESVSFAGATVIPGWKVEVKYSGPEKVEVEFERIEDDDDREIEFLARFENGELVITISES